MSIGLPKVVYNPGSGDVTLSFQRGPLDFRAKYVARVHDNVSTAGFRERVVEALDLIINFGMDHMLESDATDLTAWYTFMGFALAGGQFNFYPNVNIGTEYYHCLCDDQGFEPVRKGPGRYAAAFTFRVVPDSQAPTGGPGQVMKRFYGDAS